MVSRNMKTNARVAWKDAMHGTSNSVNFYGIDMPVLTIQRPMGRYDLSTWTPPSNEVIVFGFNVGV